MTDRRLAAILAADAVGFSARVGSDEAGALLALKASMEALELVVGLHGGRVVKRLGDGLLVEFGSVVNAVSAAAAMQTRLAERTRDLPQEACFDFRIGVHVGDVVADGDDILGDGVNVASRLEAEAVPGSVVVSGRVHEDVSDKLDLAFVDLGERSLKGIARPVRLFALAGEATPDPSPEAPALPDKPSVAVLPFENMSSDAEQDYFADGLTEDIITTLAAVPWIFVIARNSSFAYKGAAVDVRKIGRELGVRYVLEGSVRKSGQRLRITGQLVDAETGAHLWAEKLDGALDDVFDLQDRVAEAVVCAIAPEIEAAEQSRSQRKRPGNLSGYDHVLRGMASLNRAQVAEAVAHLDRAIEVSPDYAKALAMRAWCCTLKISWANEGNYAANHSAGVDFAQRALAAAPLDPEVGAYSGYTLGFFGVDLEQAIRSIRDATQRCPSFVWAWASAGMLESWQHDPERALLDCDRALRLSPRDPLAFRTHLARCAAHIVAGRPGDAVEAARRSLAGNPNLMPTHAYLVASLVALGDRAGAAEAAKALLARFPEFNLRRYRAFIGGSRNFRRLHDDMESQLRAAGLPD